MSVQTPCLGCGHPTTGGAFAYDVCGLCWNSADGTNGMVRWDRLRAARHSLPTNWTLGGEFRSFENWCNKASSWIGPAARKLCGAQEVRCLDAKNRECLSGREFMRARDEGAFPVRYYFVEQTEPMPEMNEAEKVAAQRAHGRETS